MVLNIELDVKILTRRTLVSILGPPLPLPEPLLHGSGLQPPGRAIDVGLSFTRTPMPSISFCLALSYLEAMHFIAAAASSFKFQRYRARCQSQIVYASMK